MPAEWSPDREGAAGKMPTVKALVLLGSPSVPSSAQSRGRLGQTWSVCARRKNRKPRFLSGWSRSQCKGPLAFSLVAHAPVETAGVTYRFLLSL